MNAHPGGEAHTRRMLELAELPSPFEAETLAAVRRSAEELLGKAGRL